MNKITKLFVFIVHDNGEEKIVSWPDDNGSKVPLVYLELKSVEGDGMRQKVQELANSHQLYFELREYQLVNIEKSEVFYPTKEYHA